MKKVHYKTLEIQNFLSIGNEVVKIDFRRGLNMITGKNQDKPERRNGVGKSAIIDAYYFSLFGKTIREIKKEFIVNNQTKGKGRLVLDFDVHSSDGTQSYKIIRQVKPSKVELWKGDVDITLDSIDNTNKFICDLIGSNAVIAKSCDILSLSDNIPFMAKTSSEKRKFIEDIFSLEIYGKMFKELKDIIKNNKTELSISSTRLEELQKILESLTKQKQDYTKRRNEKSQVLEEKKKLIQDKINKTQLEIESIKFLDIDQLNSKLELVQSQIKTLNSTIENSKTEILIDQNKLKDLDKKLKDLELGDIINCDKCHQKIPDTHKDHLEECKVQLQQEISSLEGNLKVKKDRYNNLLNTKNSKDDIYSKLDRAKLKDQENRSKKENLEKLIKEYKNSLDQLSEVQDEDDVMKYIEENEASSLQRRLEEEEKFVELKNIANDLDTCKFILGDDGIKTFAVKRLLDLLNNGIQKYISDLGMDMKCQFDEYFEEKITNSQGKEISYWNFSGGERRTVDLACSWAFKDLKRKISGTSSNVEFCDEIFDSAFDERGLDLLIEVTKNRIEKYELSVYAISHRKETMKHIDGEIIFLEKENQITRRIDTEDI